MEDFQNIKIEIYFRLYADGVGVGVDVSVGVKGKVVVGVGVVVVVGHTPYTVIVEPVVQPE